MGSNNFLSPTAERALLGGEEEARRLFQEECDGAFPTQTPYIPQPQKWPVGWNRLNIVIQLVPSPHTDPSFPGSTDPSTQPFEETLQPENFDNYPPGEFSDNSGPHPPKHPTDLQNFGYHPQDGVSWRCAYPGCKSAKVFTRGCDLRKHFYRHTKTLFCRHEDCPQSIKGGFSTKKDRDRHEAKHKPGVSCEWEGCERVFSRVDNMKNHVGRIHHKGP